MNEEGYTVSPLAPRNTFDTEKNNLSIKSSSNAKWRCWDDENKHWLTVYLIVNTMIGSGILNQPQGIFLHETKICFILCNIFKKKFLKDRELLDLFFPT